MAIKCYPEDPTTIYFLSLTEKKNQTPNHNPETNERLLQDFTSYLCESCPNF